jgi:hypothetical protein
MIQRSICTHKQFLPYYIIKTKERSFIINNRNLPKGSDKFRIYPNPDANSQFKPDFTPPFDETPPFGPPMGPPPGRPPIGNQPEFFPPAGPPSGRPPVGVQPKFFPPVGPPSGSQRFRRCLNRMSRITLVGGNQIWFFPTAIRRQNLVGYSWRQFNWQPSSIPLFRIRSIQCS